MGGMGIWIATQFVRSITNPPGPKGDPGPKGNDGAVGSMRVADYRQIAALLKDELNGRYMFADEARQKFSNVESKIEVLERKVDLHAGEVSSFIAKVTPLIPKHSTHFEKQER